MQRIIRCPHLCAALVMLLCSTAANAVWKPAGERIATKWAEQIDVQNVLPEYPRPLMERDEWMNLNGLWDYAIRPAGESTPDSYDGEILVPFAVESSLSGVGKELGEANELWYRRTFSVPSRWKGQRVLLHFGAVDWKATVWVNGNEAGVHTGGYTPFAFDITEYLKKGRNELTVKVWDPTDKGVQARGKQVSKPGHIWYTPVSGIWQTVWMEPVPERSIEAVRTTPDIDRGTLTVETKVSNLGAGSTVEVKVLDGNRTVASASGNGPLEIRMPEGFRLWSPDSPALYDLEILLYEDGQLKDKVKSYAAMRKYSIRTDEDGYRRMQLNNRDIFHFGPLDQGWWPDGLYTAPTDEALRYDIEKTKELGFNMIRKHLKVEPARWYTHCDRIGMIVWQDMPNGDRNQDWQYRRFYYGPSMVRTPESEATYRKEWKEVMDNLYSYPCIGVWTPFNEAMGQFNPVEIAEWTKEYDPTRPVNPASGGNYFPCGDILDLHSYPEPVMFLFDAECVNVIGEFGGIGMALKGHLWNEDRNWGYGDLKGKEEATSEYLGYAAKLKELSERGLCGAVYTQTTDVESEINGLMTYDRKVVKMDAEALRKANSEVCRCLDKPAKETHAPLSVTWKMGDISPDGTYTNTFILKNISDATVGNDWAIHYGQFPHRIRQEASPQVKIEWISGTFHKMYPAPEFTPLAPGDSISVEFTCSGAVPKTSHAPEGIYWTSRTGAGKGSPLPVKQHVVPMEPTAAQTAALDAIYKRYEYMKQFPQQDLCTYDILPSVKKAVPAKGEMLIGSRIALSFPEGFAGEAGLLKEKLESVYGIEVTDRAEKSIALEYLPENRKVPNDEYYELDIRPRRAVIRSRTPHGIFNGTQTLLAMLKGQEGALRLQSVSISDYPDLLYRGQMIDISRNFTTAQDLKKMIDIISSYKLNVLHLHFSDDEGWRLEIPGLEELTETGSRRGHTEDEAGYLYPAYDNGYDPDAPTSGNGYYSREEFIDLLRYAAARHVQVIPEIESPGHARAAIRAMKTRYDRYIASAPEKATEYMLHDPNDTSVYLSAQWYNDNVMNVVMPSTYRFMEKVIDEIALMYREAGAPLSIIHVGGDEVAGGAWTGSPLCMQLMKEKGMKTTHELAEYFITRVSGYLEQKGISFGGWQEAALGHSDGTHGVLAPRAGSIYCWSTVAEWGSDEISYQTANRGYPVVLCNVNCFYLDLAYDAHTEERGHFWAGYVDEARTFSVLPYRIYRSSRIPMEKNPVQPDTMENGKTPLKAECRQNIKGVQAQLFAETIRSYKDIEYYTFPKILGLVERGWNAHPVWEDLSGESEAQAYGMDIVKFYRKISTKEMPYWAQNGIMFRLPYPGLCMKDGKLYASTYISGGQVRYTTDGTEPTEDSPLWEAPVDCRAKEIRAKLFYSGKESRTAVLK